MLSRVWKRKPLYSLTPIHLSSIFSAHHETFQGLCYTSLLSSICFLIFGTLCLYRSFFFPICRAQFQPTIILFQFADLLKGKSIPKLLLLCFTWLKSFVQCNISISFVQIGKHIAKESMLCVHVFTWEKIIFFLVLTSISISLNVLDVVGIILKYWRERQTCRNKEMVVWGFRKPVLQTFMRTVFSDSRFAILQH